MTYLATICENQDEQFRGGSSKLPCSCLLIVPSPGGMHRGEFVIVRPTSSKIQFEANN
jgi:hypothetical protein